MQNKQEYEKQLHHQLEEWKNEIRKLTLKAESVHSDMKSECLRQIQKLREKQLEAERKLAQLHGSGDNAWQEIKQGIDKAWTNLSEAIKSAKSKFKE